MAASPKLQLAYLAPEQAQKHVTVNEALRRLDALAQLTVKSRTIAAEPASPAEGDAYILPASPSGAAWSLMSAGDVAVFQDSAWARIPPKTGWRAYVESEAKLVARASGGTWSDIGGESAAKFGVNTTADATTRFQAKADASLFSHDDVTPGSGDHRLKINKSAAAKTASLLFQDGFSGRAEFGLVGDDSFTLKTSADGASWANAFVVSAAGVLDFKQAPTFLGASLLTAATVREKLTANRTYYVRTDGSDSNTGLANTSGGAFLTLQKAVNVVAALDISTFTVTVQVGDGTYTAGVTLKDPVGAGSCVLQGNTTTPSNVVISTTSADAITADGGSKLWTITGFKLQTTTSGSGLVAKGKSKVIAAKVDHGAAAIFHIWALEGAQINLTDSYTISGGAAAHIRGSGQGSIFMTPSKTVTLSGTPAFTNFVNISLLSYLEANSIAYSGSATGARYSAQSNAVINTNSGGASYFPGNSAGATVTGAQYL